jgi:hypothetical protein
MTRVDPRFETKIVGAATKRLSKVLEEICHTPAFLAV